MLLFLLGIAVAVWMQIGCGWPPSLTTSLFCPHWILPRVVDYCFVQLGWIRNVLSCLIKNSKWYHDNAAVAISPLHLWIAYGTNRRLSNRHRMRFPAVATLSTIVNGECCQFWPWFCATWIFSGDGNGIDGRGKRLVGGVVSGSLEIGTLRVHWHRLWCWEWCLGFILAAMRARGTYCGHDGLLFCSFLFQISLVIFCVIRTCDLRKICR